jgi:hypothetical protein
MVRGSGIAVTAVALVYQCLQWNPADHLCVAGQLLRRPGDRWRLRGEVYRLMPARTPSAGITRSNLSAGSVPMGG